MKAQVSFLQGLSGAFMEFNPGRTGAGCWRAQISAERFRKERLRPRKIIYFLKCHIRIQ
jgi:hypothetical protein